MAALVAYLIFHFSKYIQPFDTLIPIIYNSSLTISATLLGFLLTILTIINSINTKRMILVRQRGKYGMLIGYLTKAILSNIIIVSFCFLLFFIKRDEVNANALMWIDYVFIFLTFYNVLLTIRFAYLFVRLLTEDE